MNSLSDDRLSWSSDLSPTGAVVLPHEESKFINTSQCCDKKGWAQGKSERHETTINMLPEDVLLDIFDCCRRNGVGYGTMNPYGAYYTLEAWHTLVHVCQGWRQTIFASPRRLELKLRFTNGTPVRKGLDYFPTLPIIIRYSRPFTPRDEDNFFAALEHPDRISHIDVCESNSQLGRIAAGMQASLPVLTVLQFRAMKFNSNVLALPDGFLGGSAPCLQEFFLKGVPFPALLTLLSSANDLVVLRLEKIPWIGYVQVSPEAMALCLATLTRLKTLQIEFQPPPLPDSGRASLPPKTRTVLPALTYFEFRGKWMYLEDLVSRIDCPQLNRIAIALSHTYGMEFRVAQLVEFVNRSDGLRPILFRRAELCYEGRISFSVHDDFLQSPASICILSERFSCEELERLVSEITYLLSPFSAILSYVAHLKMSEGGQFIGVRGWPTVGMNNTWLPLLHLFAAVQTLDIPEELSESFSLELEDIAKGTATDLLPALNLLCLGNKPVSSVEKFVAVRRDSGRPVTVVEKAEFDRRLESYLSE